MKDNPCHGLRVIELASVLAGPVVGTFFAEQGAEVLKIENARTGGDVTRGWKAATEDPNAPFSAYYASANWGKMVALADLREPRDRDRLLAQLADADVLLTNFPARAAGRLQLTPEELSRQFPQLIIGHITGFGAEDPRLAFDVVLQAETGWLSMTGQPDSPPAKLPVALIDILAAHQLTEGLLLALWRREQTGKGGVVSVSLRDASVAALANQATNYLMAGQVARPIGTRHPNIAPYGDLFITADNKAIVLAVGSNKQFAGLCDALGVPAWTSDERFYDNATRLAHRTELCSMLQEQIGQQISGPLFERMLAGGVPFGRIRPLDEVLDDTDVAGLIQVFALPDGQAARRIRSSVFTSVDSV